MNLLESHLNIWRWKKMLVSAWFFAHFPQFVFTTTPPTSAMAHQLVDLTRKQKNVAHHGPRGKVEQAHFSILHSNISLGRNICFCSNKFRLICQKFIGNLSEYFRNSSGITENKGTEWYCLLNLRIVFVLSIFILGLG